MRKDVQKHLQSSEMFLKESEHLFSGGFNNGTVGRAYYAMFHAAIAALLTKEIERTSHHSIISAFGEFIVKAGLIDEKFHRYIIEAFMLRNDCDYLAPFEADESQAGATLQRAKEFIEACKKLIE